MTSTQHIAPMGSTLDIAGLPLATEERWRRTSPQDFVHTRFDGFDARLATKVESTCYPQHWQNLRPSCHVLLVTSDRFEAEGLVLPNGVHVEYRPAQQAAGVFGDNLYFGSLQSVGAPRELVISIEDDARIEHPIVILHPAERTGNGTSLAQISTLRVVVGKNAALALTQEFVTQPAGGQILQDIELKAGGRLNFNFLTSAEFAESSGIYLHQCKVRLGREAQAHVKTLFHGSTRLKSFADFLLTGEHAHADLRGVVVGRAREHFDIDPVMHHQAVGTTSNLLLKTALTDRARAVFQGEIRIDTGAEESAAYQSNKNLLLSETARVDTLPKLSIKPSAVQCKHGAATGNIDPKQVAYLMSRGFRRDEAVGIIVDGFLSDVLKGLREGDEESDLEIYLRSRVRTWGQALIPRKAHS